MTILLLLYIHTIETARINQCDVSVSNANKNEVCLPHLQELNDQTCFQSRKLTKVINTALTLTLFHN